MSIVFNPNMKWKNFKYFNELYNFGNPPIYLYNSGVAPIYSGFFTPLEKGSLFYSDLADASFVSANNQKGRQVHPYGYNQIDFSVERDLIDNYDLKYLWFPIDFTYNLNKDINFLYKYDTNNKQFVNNNTFNFINNIASGLFSNASGVIIYNSGNFILTSGNAIYREKVCLSYDYEGYYDIKNHVISNSGLKCLVFNRKNKNHNADLDVELILYQKIGNYTNNKNNFNILSLSLFYENDLKVQYIYNELFEDYTYDKSKFKTFSNTNLIKESASKIALKPYKNIIPFIDLQIDIKKFVSLRPFSIEDAQNGNNGNLNITLSNLLIKTYYDQASSITTYKQYDYKTKFVKTYYDCGQKQAIDRLIHPFFGTCTLVSGCVNQKLINKEEDLLEISYPYIEKIETRRKLIPIQYNINLDLSLSGVSKNIIDNNYDGFIFDYINFIGKSVKFESDEIITNITSSNDRVFSSKYVNGALTFNQCDTNCNLITYEYPKDPRNEFQNNTQGIYNEIKAKIPLNGQLSFDGMPGSYKLYFNGLIIYDESIMCNLEGYGDILYNDTPSGISISHTNSSDGLQTYCIKYTQQNQIICAELDESNPPPPPYFGAPTPDCSQYNTPIYLYFYLFNYIPVGTIYRGSRYDKYKVLNTKSYIQYNSFKEAILNYSKNYIDYLIVDKPINDLSLERTFTYTYISPTYASYETIAIPESKYLYNGFLCDNTQISGILITYEAYSYSNYRLNFDIGIVNSTTFSGPNCNEVQNIPLYKRGGMDTSSMILS